MLIVPSTSIHPVPVTDNEVVAASLVQVDKRRQL